MYTVFPRIVRLRSRSFPDSESLDLWNAVSFVELLMLASAEHRAKLNQISASLLLGDFQDPVSLMKIREDDIEQMVDEIQAAWWLKQ